MTFRLTAAKRAAGLWLGALLAVFVVQQPQCGQPPNDHQGLALAALQAGRPEGALREVRRAHREGVDGASLRLVAAMALLSQERPEAALRELGTGLGLEPADRRLHLTLQNVARQTERIGLADTLVQTALTRHPDDANLLATLGWAAANQGQDERAADLLARAAELAAGNVDAWAQLARLHLTHGRWEAAAEVAQKGLLAAPGAPPLWAVLGEVRLRQGRLPEADSAFAQAVGTTTPDGDMAMEVARLYYDQGHRLAAIRFYEAALRAGVTTAALMNNLAWALAEEGIRLDEALALATRAIKKDPDSPVYLDTYAEVNFRLGRTWRAAAAIRRALEAEPPDGSNRAYLEQQSARFTAGVNHNR
jgi:tetratricopeptide (TPR) repeat protein